MYRSEKSFLERIAGVIPGIRGYREKEARRDTDKRLREYMAAEVDRRRKAVEAFKRDLLAKGKLDLLDEADRAARKLQKTADALRFASYGYAGLFDAVKLREEELERLYAYDVELLGEVQALEAPVAALAPAESGERALAELEAAVDRLDENIERRKRLFDRPE